MIAGTHAVLWVKQDGAGNDACRFADAEGGYLIDGSSTDANWNVIRYRIRARDDGTTRRVRIGNKSRIFIRRAPDDTWTINGTPVSDVTGAQDIALDFTPATFTLPIRRLKLGIGDETKIMVAKLDLEKLWLHPSHFVLRRTASNEYTCLNDGSGKTFLLSVDDHGIVRSSAGHWLAQS